MVVIITGSRPAWKSGDSRWGRSSMSPGRTSEDLQIFSRSKECKPSCGDVPGTVRPGINSVSHLRLRLLHRLAAPAASVSQGGRGVQDGRT